MFKSAKLLILSSAISLVFLGATPALGANLQDAFKTGNDGGEESILDQAAGPDGAGYRTSVNTETPDTLVGNVIQVFLSFLGVIFLILMIYGGFLWMTAAGNEQQVEKAKKLIGAAIIGVIIVMAAYAISAFVVNSFGEETLE